MIVYRFFKYLWQHITYSNILNKIYKTENLMPNLSELFGCEFRKDWLGRLYTVINPNISNGKYDPNSQFFEYNEMGLDNTQYVEKWIMDRLNIASQFIQSNNLFELLTYEIKRIDNYDNYLFVIKPITLDDCLKYSKYFLCLLTVIGIGLITFFIYK